MRLSVFLLIFLAASSSAFADQKMSAYTTAQPALTDTDVYIADPNGTPTNKKGTVASHFLAANMTVNGTNVGIASTAPGTTLDVQGTIRATTFSGDGSALTGISNSGGWTTDSSTKTNTTYNVGIGTTDPDVKLDLGTSGTITVASNEWPLIMRHADSGSTNAGGSIIGMQFQYGAPDVGGKKSGIGGTKEATFGNIVGLAFYTSNGGGSGNFLERMRILGGGNVGIGTITPIAALDVSGTVNATAFTGNGSALTGISSSNWVTQNTTDVSIAGGNVGIGTIATNTSSFKILKNGSTDYVRINSAPVLLGDVFKIDNAGNVGIGTSLTITPGVSIMNGNVGIGTWSSEALLDLGTRGVALTQSNEYPVIMRHADSGSTNAGGATVGIAFQMGAPTVGGKKAAIEGVKEATFGNNVGIGFRTSNGSGSGNFLERVRIRSDGNVGIGTITPKSLLAVSGGGAAIGIAGSSFLTSTAPTGGMIIEGNVGIGSTAPQARLTVIGNGTTTENTFSVRDSAFTQKFLIVDSGNVGIGSTSPGTLLDVQGTIRAPSSGWNIGIGTASPTRICITNTTLSICP